MGKAGEAITYAKASHASNDNSAPIARACEEILLSSDGATKPTSAMRSPRTKALHILPPAGRLFGNIPPRPPEEILRDLIRSTPGEEGRWFAAAKEAGLLELAIEVADRSPADPRTLTHAARDFRDKNPAFAIGAGLAAVRWLGEGYGYEVTGADVWAGLFSDKRGG